MNKSKHDMSIKKVVFEFSVFLLLDWLPYQA